MDRRTLAWIAIACAALLCGQCPAQSPSITHCLPGAVKPGTTTGLQFHGNHLDGASALWTSFKARATLAQETNKTLASFRLEVPEDVPAGIGAVRLLTRQGLSSLHLLMIDDLPSLVSTGTNHTPATAQLITPPVAVDGVCDALKLNYYRFTARKGERLAVEAVGQRAGSLLDPVVRLLDAQGRELAYNDDAPGLCADCRLAHRFAATGEYLLEVRDAKYEGGPRHRYRLRVGDFPIVSTPFPLGVQHGRQVTASILGWDVAGLAAVPVRAPASGSRMPLNARHPQGHDSAMLALVLDDLPELVEAEPNNLPGEATELAVPCAINGRFDTANDRDCFRFTAGKGQRLWFAGQTRSLGSPSELFLRLYSGDGKQLAEANVAGADEGGLTNTFPADGAYCLRVEELNRRGGPEHGYRVVVRPYAGFDLTVETDKIEAAAGGAFTLKVAAQRRDYDGPITLAVEGLGDAVSLDANVIGEKKQETQLQVKLPGTVEAGRLVHFTLLGRAQINGAVYQTTASTQPALRKLFPETPCPPADLDGLIGLFVKPADAKPKPPAP